jgi:hypothetical protein
MVVRYIALHGFVACQTTAIDLEIHFHSSPHQQQGYFMVSSLLPTVCLQSAEGISPQNSLVFALLHAFCFCRFCSRLWIVRQKLSYDRVNISRPSWATRSRCFKTWRNWSGPLQGWIGSLSARGPFWQFLVIARLSNWLSIIPSGEIMKYVKNVKILFLKHSLCFPEPVPWQVLAASSVVRSAYSRPFGSTSRPLGL